MYLPSGDFSASLIDQISTMSFDPGRAQLGFLPQTFDMASNQVSKNGAWKLVVDYM